MFNWNVPSNLTLNNIVNNMLNNKHGLYFKKVECRNFIFKTLFFLNASYFKCLLISLIIKNIFTTIKPHLYSRFTFLFSLIVLNHLILLFLYMYTLYSYYFSNHSIILFYISLTSLVELFEESFYNPLWRSKYFLIGRYIVRSAHFFSLIGLLYNVFCANLWVIMVVSLCFFYFSFVTH